MHFGLTIFQVFQLISKKFAFIDINYEFRNSNSMKKLIIVSSLALFAVSCGNNTKSESELEQERDSAIEEQKAINQEYVDSMMQAEMNKDNMESEEKMGADSGQMHEGHEHESHDHEGHSH